jgi:gliding motility-associated-like protein
MVALGQNIEFIENKGQWDNQVRFKGEVTNGAFFVHQNGFTVLQHKSEDLEQFFEASHHHTLNGKPYTPEQSITIHSHAYKVEFVNANPKAVPAPDKPLYTYNNYFIGNDPSKWASNCKIYQGITVKDIYPNIDVRYYSDNNTLKYDLIVRPGANISDIALKYEGADKLEIKKKELIIHTSVGDLKELEPYTYQYNKEGKVQVEARYSVKDNVVRFNIKDYDPSTTMVIDPGLVFCSFTGSTADNWGFTATYGPDGSMYGGGIVFGSGFPVSNGAFQTNYGGGSGTWPVDIGIIKLTPNGTGRTYATYIGGGGSDVPQSMIVDPQGELIVAGRTSSGNYPVKGTPTTSGTGFDIVVTKLTADGTGIIGSVKIGGTGDDGANITQFGGGSNSLQRNYGDEARSEVNLDASGNIYLASCTQATDFPVTAGAFQTANGGGVNTQDGVVLKFDANVSLLFSSYFGGNGNDAAYVLSLAPNGNIYIAGGTESDNLPGRSAPAISISYNGGIDGFVSIISNNGSSVLKTTYIGTTDADQVYGIQFDKFGYPYIMGTTTGFWNVLNAAWSQANGKQFICKMQPDLSAYVYSTKFGSGDALPNISPVAFLVDRCENVYISGWGAKSGIGNYPIAGVAGLTTTSDAIKPTPDINPSNGAGEDFYFFVLKRDAQSQLYGSFFGQNGGQFPDHVDGGTSRFDRNGVIYQAICANCGKGTTFPTYPNPGAWSTTNKAANGGCNLAMVKIAFDLAGVSGGPQSFIEGTPRDTSGCVPLTVDFRDTVQRAVSYEWNFGDGPGITKTTLSQISHTYTTVGVFRVMMVAIDSASCNIRDTTYLNIRVGDIKAVVDFVPHKLSPPCDAFNYRFDNTSFAPAIKPFGPQSFIWDFGDNSPRVTAGTGSVFHQYLSPGTYNVRLFLNDTSYCNYPDTAVIQLRVAALVKAKFETPSTGCAPYLAQFDNTSEAGSKFTWTFGDNSAPSNQVSPTHLYQNPGTYIVKLVAEDTATCNRIDSTTFTITIYGKPTSDFSAAPQPPLTNTPISFTNLSSADATKFKWEFGDDETLETTSRAVVQHEYNATKTYSACLIVANPAGCADTVCKDVRMVIDPAVDVPNAFTPLSGGVNSVVYVRGFGIAKMQFAIYARWGEKVFETNSKKIGWDGYYKGKLLPMDAYAYTLSVEFSDGTKTTKTGDITLIR